MIKKCLFAVIFVIAGCGGHTDNSTHSASSLANELPIIRYPVLSWQAPVYDPNSSIDGYRIYRSDDQFNFKLIADLGPEVQEFTDDLPGSAPYYWWYITAYNEIGESDPSSIVGKEVSYF